MNKDEKELTITNHYSSKTGNLGYDIITDIDADSYGNIWISTDGGGVNILPGDGSPYIELKKSEDAYSLSTNAVYKIYKDDQGTIWLGTFAGGINYFPERKLKFVHYRNIPNQKINLPSNAIISVYEDANRDLIIGTDGGGVRTFDPDARTFSKWETKDISEFDITKSIFQDVDGRYWIGTYGHGLYKFNPQKKLIKKYEYRPDDPSSISHKSIWKIYQASDGTIWIGTLGGGLMRYVEEEDNFYRYNEESSPKSLSNNIVRAIVEDNDRNIWIGTSNGLNCLHPDTQEIEKYFFDPKSNSISDNDIRCFYKDKNARNELDLANQNLIEINKTLEQRVKIRTQELEKSNEELDRFVYSASHDISAPLKSLLGLITLARMDRGSENMANYIDHMELSVHRLDDVITNLIQHSKNAKQVVARNKVYLNKIVNDVIHSLQYLNSAKEKINFIVDIKPELVIETDESRIRIILNNLISNSIKYHNYHQESPFIAVEMENNQQDGVLIVEDNGTGISEEYKDDIFNMFFRASSNSTGAGLGLYIVKETVDKLKGKIEIETTFGKGTKFYVWLPGVFDKIHQG